jgi:hypothetical protein
MYAKPLIKQNLLVVDKKQKRNTKVIPVTHLNGGKLLLPKPPEGYIKCKKHDPL